MKKKRKEKLNRFLKELQFNNYKNKLNKLSSVSLSCLSPSSDMSLIIFDTYKLASFIILLLNPTFILFWFH